MRRESGGSYNVSSISGLYTSMVMVSLYLPTEDANKWANTSALDLPANGKVINELQFC